MATQLVKGNTAVIIGALYAGCDSFFGYPITPASEILHEAAQKFPQAGRCMVQAESEEAAINMVFGAATTGRRAMTASSGPGISLKSEGISYLAGAQLPAVVVDIMRAGPGLGNIGPEQGDYNQVVKGGGHGNYRNIVLAPASVQEMCDLTMRAFELSQKWRMVAVVLADGVLGQMIEPLRFPEQSVAPETDTSWAVDGTAATRPNVVTSIFLDFDQQEAFNNQLQEKYAAVEAAEQDVECIRMEDADIALVAYGISARIAQGAVEAARAEGIRAGLFRPKTLFPFPKDALNAFVDQGGKQVICVEMSNGQMCDDVKLAIECRCPVHLVNRLGGNLVTEGAVLTALRETAKQI
ncbi:MAG: 3-methyl-2-oxobutanoate dehydrogenase subunit VorB [Kiritimatiellae bacterium]|nr:3-methyl-2-oxobutanoate dehydrogenase subunit VorB [Kiritimatiellia bacterium]MDD4341867.1 3-methyl-2-oxobutanoate dehydrogenase subunit VorB [Kiritimatiellia bacterium]